MRRLSLISSSLFAIALAALFFAVPSQTHAEDICCKCVPQNMSEPPTLCYTVPSLKSGDNCSTLPTEQNMNGLDCDPKKLTAAQCKKLSGSGGGICTTDPEPAKPTRLGELVSSGSNADSNSSASSSLLPTALEFNTPIPQFKAPTDMGLLFASYVIAIYRYMISIAVFVATVMFIWGAFRYLVGSGLGGVARGKQIMSDAVIGLILVLSANLILRTINPDLMSLKTLTIKSIQNVPLNGLIGIEYSKDILSELGDPPRSTGGKIPNYGIPTSCPTRNPKLTEDTIDKYLKQQSYDGIPAAIVIAQIANETNECAAHYLFTPDKLAKCSYTAAYFNFGGRRCSSKIPSASCEYLALPGQDKENSSLSYDLDFVNAKWNSKQTNPSASSCMKLASTQKLTNYRSYDCGEECFPVSTYTSFYADGEKNSPPAIQCLQKFNNVQEFLIDHNKNIKPCLPFNDSVYDFAYCVGLSNYAGSYLKAKVLADYIEKNCLCDPEKDAKKCIRDKKLEAEITQAHIKKINLLRIRSNGTSTNDPVVEALWRATGGALYPGPSDALSKTDLTPTTDE
jgi:hypothetical protein